MDFEELINAINETNDTLQKRAVSSINKYLTIRNWLIGFYIVEFEQNGKDRAKYGDKLLEVIANKLNAIKGLSIRSLYIFKKFYLTYPQILQTLSAELKTDKNLFLISDNIQKEQLLTDLNKKNNKKFGIKPDSLLNELSFSHIVELLKADDSLKRSFYEIECLKGRWSVRELKRQMGSLYFERMGLSKDKEKLSEYTQNQSVKLIPDDIIQDPFFFEFLNLNDRDTLKESDLESSLIDKLSDFILELGHGFCFEARQKRLTIGGEYYYIDLLFYHRILKCHVIIDLKLGKFSHADAGQMNVYLNYYKKNEMTEGDNPPVGLILCADKSNSLVEYATSGMDNQLFVSKYMLALPSKEELQKFIDNEISKREN